MGLLTQAELDPLQAARRVAEEQIEAIRAIALARGGDIERYHKIADVVGALQTIYDTVSELEFEDEPDPVAAPPDEPEEEEEQEEEEEEDDDDDDDA